MANKANQFALHTTPQAYVITDVIGGVVPVGVNSALSFRVDVILTAGDVVDIDLEVFIGNDQWKTYGALTQDPDALNGILIPTSGLPLGAKVRLKATGSVTVSQAFITLER